MLSIQPLVENAVQHGLFPKLTQGKLRIAATVQGDIVEIAVIDNGIGIEPARLEALFSAEAEGIGVQNVHLRLQGFYGEQFGLVLESLPDSGTKAVIRIPYVREADSYELESHCC